MLLAADDYSAVDAELSPLLVEEVNHWRSPWLWLAALMTGLWLLTLLVLVRMHLWPRWQQAAELLRARREHEISLSQHQKRLRKACASQDADAVRQALVAWAACLWPRRKTDGLSVIARRCEGHLCTEIQALERALYSSAEHWQGGQALWQAFEAQAATLAGEPVVTRKKKKQQTGLASLHKIS